MARGAASPVSRIFTALTSGPASFASSPQGKVRMDWPLLPFRCAAAAGELPKDQWHLLQIRDYKGSKWEQVLCRGEREFWGANWGRRKEKHPSTPHWLSHWILLSRFSTYTLPGPLPQSAYTRRGADYPQISVPPPDPWDRIPLSFLTAIQPVLEALHFEKLHAEALCELLPSICPDIFCNIKFESFLLQFKPVIIS